MTFQIKSESVPAKRSGTCAADGYELERGDDVLLMIETSKGDKPKWHVFCADDVKCVGLAKSWVEAQDEEEKKPPTKKSKKSKKSTKKNDYQFGDERNDSSSSNEILVTANAVAEALRLQQDKHDNKIGDLLATISGLNNRLEILEKWQKKIEAQLSPKGRPPRTPADENFEPVTCLGIKSDGSECKQSGAKITNSEYPGFCYQHRGQSGNTPADKADKAAAADKQKRVDSQKAVTSGADLLNM